MAANVASLALGNNACSGRRMKPEVCDEESRSLEPMKIRAAQMIGGPYRQRRLVKVAELSVMCAGGGMDSSSIMEEREYRRIPSLGSPVREGN